MVAWHEGERRSNGAEKVPRVADLADGCQSSILPRKGVERPVPDATSLMEGCVVWGWAGKCAVTKA